MNNPLEWVATFWSTSKTSFSNCIFQLSPLFTGTLQNAQFELLLKRIHIYLLAFCIAFAGHKEHLAKWGEVSVHLVTSQRAEWVLNTQFMKSGASKPDEQWTEIVLGGAHCPAVFYTRFLLHSPGAFRCGVWMFFSCLRGFTPGFLPQSKNQNGRRMEDLWKKKWVQSVQNIFGKKWDFFFLPQQKASLGVFNCAHWSSLENELSSAHTFTSPTFQKVQLQKMIHHIPVMTAVYTVHFSLMTDARENLDEQVGGKLARPLREQTIQNGALGCQSPTRW